MAEFVTVYNQAGQMLAVLDNADEIGYTLPHNDLWTGTFKLPADDPKNAYCEAFNFVRLPDGPRGLGTFRIIGMPSAETTAAGGLCEYSLEHAMATLLDDILFGYHEVGGAGVSTAQVMQYILSKQTVTRWQLGACEFNDNFAYKFENTNLLAALLSLGEVIADEYTWDFDTSTSPWTVNLRHADATPGCGLYYARNLLGIENSYDATSVVTRIYPLGYGEGVNQLRIGSVNSGLDYIDADTITRWGTKSAPFTDTRIEDAATLKARAAAALELYKNPYFSYTATAIDLYRATGQSWDDCMPGKLVRVMDGEHGVNFTARVASISKSDTCGDPGGIEITIANAARDAADTLNSLADRVGIHELYSQGATNLFAVPFADNADASHPAKMRVYLSRGLVRVNQMLLSWRLENFRAYETGAEAGGSTTQTSSSGGGSTQTSQTGGASTQTSEAGGAETITKNQNISVLVTIGSARSETGGDLKSDTGSAHLTVGTSSILTTEASSGALVTGDAGSHSHGMGHYHDGLAHTHTIASHSHSGPSHAHTFSDSATIAIQHRHKNTDTTYTDYMTSNNSKDISISGTTSYNGTGNTGGTTLTTDSGGPSATSGAKLGGAYRPNTDDAGTHHHTMATHTHGMEHTHTIADHTHSMRHSHDAVAAVTVPGMTIDIPAHTHKVGIPGHTHNVDIPAHTHDVTQPAHTHGITYGIFEGGKASSVSILVDGSAVPAAALTGTELDIVPYLATDDDGKITRGAWHEIQIVPDTLTRIEANLCAQCFIQSVGGGDY